MTAQSGLAQDASFLCPYDNIVIVLDGMNWDNATVKPKVAVSV